MGEHLEVQNYFTELEVRLKATPSKVPAKNFLIVALNGIREGEQYRIRSFDDTLKLTKDEAISPIYFTISRSRGTELALLKNIHIFQIPLLGYSMMKSIPRYFDGFKPKIQISFAVRRLGLIVSHQMFSQIFYALADAGLPLNKIEYGNNITLKMNFDSSSISPRIIHHDKSRSSIDVIIPSTPTLAKLLETNWLHPKAEERFVDKMDRYISNLFIHIVQSMANFNEYSQLLIDDPDALSDMTFSLSRREKTDFQFMSLLERRQKQSLRITKRDYKLL